MPHPVCRICGSSASYPPRVAGTSTESPAGGFLSRLHPRDRAELTGAGHPRRYPRGAYLIVQGDHSDTVFLLVAGRVKISLVTLDGRETVLAVDGPGDLLGVFEAIDHDGGPRAASNTALEPVECRVITGEEFRGFLDSHPRVVPDLLRWIIHRLRTADRRRIDTGSLDVAQRLALLLLELADQHGQPDANGIEIDIPLTQADLASLIAASRDAVVRALTTLRSHMLITTARRKITITDIAGLRRYPR